MAKQTDNPVALVCSSGSALLNYYPAIAEAYYSNIPLLVISADRPQYLIDIGDGQTIRQKNVFANHIGFSANLDNTIDNFTLLNKAFRILKKNGTPIHINVPFDEPLYETTTDVLIDTSKWTKETKKESLLSEEPLVVDELQKFADIWNSSTKKMVLVGVNTPSEILQVQLDHIIKDPSVIVLTENTSNLVNYKFINSIDQAIFAFSDVDFENFKPDILLTFGGMIISKKIKQFLRKFQPDKHWHIGSTKAMDTFHCLSHHFPVSPTLFFSQFFFLSKTKESEYQSDWLSVKNKRLTQHKAYIEKINFSDLKAFELINKHIATDINLEFSNSSIIRYAQLFSWDKQQHISCNRGTSGIDGSTSTAVGVSVSSNKQTVFITGDISFFYDSNALWNQYIPNNFRIILLNNSGGGIFRFIPGPTSTNTLDYFETPHNKTAEQLCKMHNLDYQTASNQQELSQILSDFFKKNKKPKLLEIFTPKLQNAAILKAYFECFISTK